MVVALSAWAWRRQRPSHFHGSGGSPPGESTTESGRSHRARVRPWQCLTMEFRPAFLTLHRRSCPAPTQRVAKSDGRADLDGAAVPGHGTGMASLIAAQGTRTGFVGVAPQAEILPIVTKNASTTATAIRYAVDHGAKVINISQGSPSATCSNEDQKSVAYAIQHDAVVIAAAGTMGMSPTVLRLGELCGCIGGRGRVPLA